MRRDIRDELARLPPEYRLDMSKPVATPLAPKPAPVEAPTAPVDDTPTEPDAPPSEQADAQTDAPTASVEAQPKKPHSRHETMTTEIDTLNRAREDLTAARLALETAKTELAETEARRLALAAGAVLTDAAAMKRLEKATEDAERARRTVDNLSLVVTSAEDAVHAAELNVTMTKRRVASARVRALTEQLTEQAQRIDALITEAVSLIGTAADTEREVATIAGRDLNCSWASGYLGRVVGERLGQHASLIKGGGTPGPFEAAAAYVAKTAASAKGGWYQPE